MVMAILLVLSRAPVCIVLVLGPGDDRHSATGLDTRIIRCQRMKKCSYVG